MSCERHTGAIVDYACGAEIAAEAAAHLQTCASCQRMFAEQQRLVEGIDQELQLALEIEPSPGFVPDVLARVQRPAFPWRTVMWWGAPAAAAAALILVVLGWPRVTGSNLPIGTILRCCRLTDSTRAGSYAAGGGTCAIEGRDVEESRRAVAPQSEARGGVRAREPWSSSRCIVSKPRSWSRRSRRGRCRVT